MRTKKLGSRRPGKLERVRQIGHQVKGEKHSIWLEERNATTGSSRTIEAAPSPFSPIETYMLCLRIRRTSSLVKAL